MYVWGRALRVAATHRSRGPFGEGSESRLRFRCLPTDIDANLHLNNARYLMLADMGRLDIFLRSGLMRLARRNRWVPMLGGIQAAYVREIRIWQSFELVSTIETWSATEAIGSHRFIREDGTVAAILMTTAGFYDLVARRFLPIEDILSHLGFEAQPRPFTASEDAFVRSHRNLRRDATAASARAGRT